MDEKNKRFGAFDKTYNEYYGIETDVINDKTASLSFANIESEIKPIKNLDLFAELSKLNKELDKCCETNTFDNYLEKYMKIYNKYLTAIEPRQQGRMKRLSIKKSKSKTSKTLSKRKKVSRKKTSKRNK